MNLELTIGPFTLSLTIGRSDDEPATDYGPGPSAALDLQPTGFAPGYYGPDEDRTR